jgi:hypothetical protein
MRVLAILSTVVILLLLIGVTLASSVEPLPAVRYVILQGTTSGGSYYLNSQSWQVSGVAAGAGYYLRTNSAPTGNGTPCCCDFLPCVLNNH